MNATAASDFPANRPAFWRSSIGRRLLISILAFSSAITLSITAFEIYIDYHHGMSAITERLRQVERSYATSLGESLWYLDKRQIEHQLRGIADLPDIRVVELREINSSSPTRFAVAVERNQGGGTASRDIEIPCTCGGLPRVIGTLHVEATLGNLYLDIAQRILVILSSQALKTFLVATFILFIVHRLVTRHLLDLAGAVASFSPGTGKPFRLALRRNAHDEFDDLVDTFNSMGERLHRRDADLSAATARVRSILDNIPDLAWIKDPEGRFLAVNRPLALTLGLSEPGDMIGKTDFDFSPPEIAEKYARDDIEVMHRDTTVRTNELHVRPDGSTFHIETIKSPLHDGDGRIVGIVGIARDMTDRTALEERLRRTVEDLSASDRRYRELIDALPVGIFEDEPDTGRVYVSDLWCTVTGLSSTELLGQGWVRAVHPDDRERVLAAWTAAAAGNGIYQSEHRLCHQNGRVTWVMARAVPRFAADGTLRGYIGSITDISERKQMEVALRTSEASFRSLAENLPDMVVRMDRDGRFIYATPLVCRVQGKSLDQILGKTLVELSPPGWIEHADKLAESVRSAVADGVPNSVYTCWNTPDGDVHSHVTHIPEFNDTGEVVTVLGISRDVTAQKRIEEELRKTAAALEGLIKNLPGVVFRMRYPADGPKQVLFYDGRGTKNRPNALNVTSDAFLNSYHPDDRQALFEELPRRLRQVDEVVHEFRVRMQDGSYQWRRAWERVVERHGDEFVTEGIAIDITDEVLAKQALEKSEQEFRTLAENAPNIIMRYDRDCRRLYVNPAYEISTRITRDDAVNVTPDAQWVNVHPPVEVYKDKLRQVMDSGTPDQIVVSWLRDENWISHAIHLAPERDADGTVIGVLAIGHDITQVTRTKNQLQSLIDNLPGLTFRLTARADGRRRMVFTGGSGMDLPDSLRDHEWSGSEVIPHVHPDDRERVVKEAREQIPLGRIVLRYRLALPDDQLRWVAIRCRVVQQTAGELVIDGMMIDVTEEVTAKQALEESEQRYRELVEALPVGVFEDEPGKGCVYASDLWSVVTGLPPEEILGYGWTKALHPDDSERVAARWIEDSTAQRVHMDEFRIRHVDGRDTWVMARAVPRLAADGTFRGYVGSINDISERKAYEASLERINRVLRTVAAGNEAMMQIPDKPAFLQQMCEVLVTIGGYRMAWIGMAEPDKTVTPVASAGKHLDYLDTADVRWDDSERGSGPTGTAIRTGLPQVTNDMENSPAMAPWRQAGLECKFLSNLALPLKRVGTVIGCLTIYSEDPHGFADEEVTVLSDFAANIAFTVQAMRERRRRQEIEQHLQQAQKMEALGLLAGSVAHDFNNLLGAIQGFAGFIVEDAKDGDTASYYGQRILLAGKRGRALIGQILSFSRQVDTKRQRFSLAELLADTKALLNAAIPTTTRLAVSTDGGALEVVGDRELLGQAIINLCVNAHDALSGAHGTITLQARPADPSTPRYTCLTSTRADGGDSFWRDDGSWAHGCAGRIDFTQPCVSVMVSDTGSGMDQHILEKIFTPFFTTKKSGQGTGLGLTAVHRAVMAHQGAILVDSLPGRGTTFEIILPCGETLATPAAAPEAEIRQRAVATGGRVLLVDDDPDFGDMLLTALERRGFEVSPCTDPLEALAGLNEFPNAWDALVTDQTMPNMTGLDLIRSAKEGDPDLVCILCTGYAEDTLDQATLEQAGVEALLRKPIDIDELVARLAEALAR